jgi:hypothetical protein
MNKSSSDGACRDNSRSGQPRSLALEKIFSRASVLLASVNRQRT